MEESIKKLPEYNNHEEVVHVLNEKVGLNGYIAIHKIRGNFPSLGATRLWGYEKDEDALRDSLRLAKLMSYKSALAGLPYGGAKAALIPPEGGIKNREEYFAAYAEEVNKLNGRFVTGTDVGVTNEDLDIMRKHSRFFIGTGVDSGYFTSKAIYYCIEKIVKRFLNKNSVNESSFAIQGAGSTGFSLLKLLVEAGVKKIFITDVSLEKIEKVKREFQKIVFVSPEDIMKQDVDVFCPCALSGVLNENSLEKMKCKVVIGSANNQLAAPEIGNKLHEMGIFYAPDYLVNAGGIISVVDQFINEVGNEKRIEEQLKVVSDNLEKIIEGSLERNLPPDQVADELAEIILKKEELTSV